MTAAGGRDLLKSSKTATICVHPDHQPVAGRCLARYLGDPTVADAILDRLIHNAYD